MTDDVEAARRVLTSEATAEEVIAVGPAELETWHGITRRLKGSRRVNRSIHHFATVLLEGALPAVVQEKRPRCNMAVVVADVVCRAPTWGGASHRPLASSKNKILCKQSIPASQLLHVAGHQETHVAHLISDRHYVASKTWPKRPVQSKVSELYFVFA